MPTDRVGLIAVSAGISGHPGRADYVGGNQIPCRADHRFAIETTLSVITYARMIPSWRSAGYPIKLIFLALASPEEAIARVAMRVRQGGHSIPEETIRRRFHGGLNNFLTVYRQRVDFWQWYDNSGDVPQLIDEGANP